MAIIEESDDMEPFRYMQNKTFARQGLENNHSLELLNRVNEACKVHNAKTILVAKDAEGEYSLRKLLCL